MTAERVREDIFKFDGTSMAKDNKGTFVGLRWGVEENDRVELMSHKEKLLVTSKAQRWCLPE